MLFTAPPGSAVAEPGKRVRLDTGSLPFPEPFSTVHSGEGVVNPRVPISYLVPPYPERTWSSDIGHRSLTFSMKTDKAIEHRSEFHHGDSKYTYVLDVIHANAAIAEWYIGEVNERYRKWREEHQGAAVPVGFTLSDLYHPKDVLADIAARWRDAGVNEREPDPNPSSVDLAHERAIGTVIRGQSLIRNYLDCGLSAGDYEFTVLMFIPTTETKITFGMDSVATFVAGEFDAPLRFKYLPQFVAVRHPDKKLPLSRLRFEMDQKTYCGREYIVGICIENPKREFTKELPHHTPIIDRGSRRIDPSVALTMNFLIHSN
jgi:hypothetical protein